MGVKRVSPGRFATALALLVCLGPPLAVMLLGFHTSVPVALIVPVALALALAAWLPELPLSDARRHVVLTVAWLIVVGAGGVQAWRASAYAADAMRPEYSVVPSNPWRVEHSCFSAYAEAARFASDRVANIYDRALYVLAPDRPRHIGPLKVDPFHYPPTFLLLPGTIRLFAPEFFDTRRVWFGLQALVLGISLLAVAWWIGGTPGRRVALLAPVAWAAPATFASLQMGNFQITAIPLALLGAMLAWSGRDAAGGGLLAFTAAGKVFPSMLVLHALAAFRSRVALWIAGSAVVFALATAAAFGTAPFVEFVRDELPQLVSGAAFPQTEVPGIMPVNMSVYGMTAKLRLLGATWLDQSSGKHVSQLYALLLAALVVWSGRRVRDSGIGGDLPTARLQLAMLWLAILNLSSLGGPFVPVMYGTVGTLWVLTLLAAEADVPSHAWGPIGLLAVMAVAVMTIPTPNPKAFPAPSTLALSIVFQVVMFGVNVWAVSAWFWRTRHARHRTPLSPQPGALA